MAAVSMTPFYRQRWCIATTDMFPLDTNQMARRRIGDQGPIERNGGAKPRLLVENTENTTMPPNNATGTATVNQDKRLLEE
jgi:hypothetical protein